MWDAGNVTGIYVWWQRVLGEPLRTQNFERVRRRRSLMPIEWATQEDELVQMMAADRAAQPRVEHADECNGFGAIF